MINFNLWLKITELKDMWIETILEVRSNYSQEPVLDQAVARDWNDLLNKLFENKLELDWYEIAIRFFPKKDVVNDIMLHFYSCLGGFARPADEITAQSPPEIPAGVSNFHPWKIAGAKKINCEELYQTFIKEYKKDPKSYYDELGRQNDKLKMKFITYCKNQREYMQLWQHNKKRLQQNQSIDSISQMKEVPKQLIHFPDPEPENLTSLRNAIKEELKKPDPRREPHERNKGKTDRERAAEFLDNMLDDDKIEDYLSMNDEELKDMFTDKAIMDYFKDKGLKSTTITRILGHLTQAHQAAREKLDLGPWRGERGYQPNTKYKQEETG